MPIFLIVSSKETISNFDFFWIYTGIFDEFLHLDADQMWLIYHCASNKRIHGRYLLADTHKIIIIKCKTCVCDRQQDRSGQDFAFHVLHDLASFWLINKMHLKCFLYIFIFLKMSN